MSAKISRADWRKLMDYPWRPADADRGCVAVDSDRVVGFLGLVYADRTLPAKPVRFCNICAWYLLKAYRGQGIGRRIQAQSVADRRATYTILTATEATGRAFSGSGFGVLDGERYVVRRSRGRNPALELSDDIGTIERRLDGAGARILRDHRPYNLRHLLFADASGQCYVVLQVKRKGDDIDYYELLHASDGAFLRRHARGIANVLLPADRSVLAFDQRFLDRPAPFERETMPLPRWYRSGDVHRGAIDHLYSEIVLLDLKL